MHSLNPLPRGGASHCLHSPVSCLCTHQDDKGSSPEQQLTRACTTLCEAGCCHGLLLVHCLTASSTQTSCCTKALSAKPHVGSDDSSSSPVKQLLESVPAAMKQHAVRGRAGILKRQGDNEDAEALLSQLVQSKEQFADVQHLTQADYGALLHEQGKVKVCADLLA